MEGPVLTLHARAKPMRVATALRRYMAMRGYRPLPRGSSEPPAVRFTLYPASSQGFVAVLPEPAEQLEDHVGGFLSQELRTAAWSLVFGEGVVALRSWQAGQPEAVFGMIGGDVKEDHDAGWARDLAAGREPGEVLGEIGLAWFSGEPAPKRSIVAGFAIGARADAGTGLEIDPLLACPECGQPMARRPSKFGMFYGCVRFPDCKGVLSEAAAEKARTKTTL